MHQALFLRAGYQARQILQVCDCGLHMLSNNHVRVSVQSWPSVLQNSVSGEPFGCAEKSDQCCSNRVCGIGQTCCPTANMCQTAGETCCGLTVCSQYQVCCGAFGKTCINTLEEECCNNQPCPKGKCCCDGTCADLSGDLCCGLSQCAGRERLCS